MNVVIYRLPNNLSVVRPRSFCPKCKNIISWRENIPLLSWLLQRGKCISCNERISIKYPLIELFSGLLFVLFVNSKPYIYNSINQNLYPFNYFENIFSWFFLSLLFLISFIDFKHFWIPQIFINLGFFFGCLNILYIQFLSNFSNLNLLIECLSASIFSYIIFEIIRISARYFFKRDALGKGDSKLVSMMALWLGPLGISLGIGIAYVVAAILILLLLQLKKIKKRQIIPFAPFLSIGGLTVWYFGNEFLLRLIYNI
jgi:leader peptidase (prepilin peptidase)/N-methyltransferase